MKKNPPPPHLEKVFVKKVIDVLKGQKALFGTSFLQCRYGLSYMEAIELMNRLFKNGIIGPKDESGKQLVLVYKASEEPQEQKPQRRRVRP